MGPRRIRRGDRGVSITFDVPFHSFNGATANSPWRTRRQRHSHSPASMLQWGHGEFGVENAEYARLADAAEEASMGPRRIRRGEPSYRSTGSGRQPRLQWGHGEFAV